MAKNNMNESFVQSVKNYSSQIKVIDDEVLKVRQTADVYIGKLGDVGFLTMIREILQNALDEILKGESLDKVVRVWYDELTYCFTVEDHGRGIPHGIINDLFGKTHSSSNYDKMNNKNSKYSAGKNGCGAAVTNMLSHNMMVESYIFGKGVHAEFIEGKMSKEGEMPIKKNRIEQGTIVSFIPSEVCLKVPYFTIGWVDVFRLISLIIPLCSIGTTCIFEAKDKNGVIHSEKIVNECGIKSHLMSMTSKPIVPPIDIMNDNGIMKMDMTFTYDASIDNNFENTLSFNNTCPTTGGTHLDGAIDGITKFFREYMNKVYLVNTNSKLKNKLICGINDIKQGLKLVISSFILEPVYTGQSKEILSNPEMKEFVSLNTYNGLNEWSKTHSTDLQKLCKYFKDIIDLRMKQDKEKIKLSNNYQSSVFGGLPSKYKRPNNKTGIELVIVEGDSAFGSAENSRDNNTQGIIPVRGKIINAIDQPRSKVLANEECSSILRIMDCGYGDKFDLSKCKVDECTIMADADDDGLHIRNLICNFFVVFCKPFVNAGRLYAAIPPLYGIQQGKNKFKYFTTKNDYISYVISMFTNDNVICDANNKKISNKELALLFERMSDYARTVDAVAASNGVYPLFLEDVMFNLSLPYNKFKSYIEKKYRFINVDKKNGTIVITGIAYDKYQTLFINDIFFANADYLFKLMKSIDPIYYLNGQPSTMYMLINAYSKYEPSNLSRFKGLGEMDPKMLADSTLRPDGNRTRIQYTVEDVDKVEAEMRRINADKGMLLRNFNSAKYL